MDYPESIKKLVDHLARLPGLGPKTAERLVFYLLNQPKERLVDFGLSVEHLKDHIIQCDHCYNFSEISPCPICADQRRDHQTVCVVAKPQDLMSMEKIGQYHGVYHLLGGIIDPLGGVTPDKIKIKELINRLKNDHINEVILALNPDMAGETTIIYLTKLLKQFRNLKVTRLARGLPIGGDLGYADEVTLSNALKGRGEI